MNLSDFQNSAREKLSSLQGTAREVDFSDTLVRLVIIGLLPFTACLIILAGLLIGWVFSYAIILANPRLFTGPEEQALQPRPTLTPR